MNTSHKRNEFAPKQSASPWQHDNTKAAAALATNLADGAHGPHVAFIARAVFGRGQQQFGVEEGFGVQGVQASVDRHLTHRTQVTVAPDLQFGRVLRRDPEQRGDREEESATRSGESRGICYPASTEG